MMELRKALENVCDANRNMSNLLLALSEDVAEASKYQSLIADICDMLRQDERTKIHTQEYNFSKTNRLLPFLVYSDSKKLAGAFATEEFAMDFVDGQREIDPDSEYIIKTFER